MNALLGNIQSSVNCDLPIGSTGYKGTLVSITIS